MERLAIGAGDGLNSKMFALVRAAGDPSAITALGTFEQIGAAHRRYRSLDKASARKSSLKTEWGPFYRSE